MPVIDFAALAAPISDAEPCGPDLERAEDAVYLRVVARAEGLLPSSFFERDRDGNVTGVFDRTRISDKEFEEVVKLLAQTRDIRLLTILARFLALHRDLTGFASCVTCMASLVDAYWDHLHPQGEDGDYALRMVALGALDDQPTVILPLQHIPLVTSRRFGLIHYRHHLIAKGEARAREGEDVPDTASIETALAEADLTQLDATRRQIDALCSALRRIQAACAEKADHEQAVRFDKLAPLAQGMFTLLDAAVTRRDPSAAVKREAAAPAGTSAAAETLPSAPPQAIAGGRIRSARDAAQALRAVSAYFNAFEPSSPAALLVQQAEQLMGKSFLEVMRILVPSHADRAIIQIGADGAFALTADQLSAVSAANGAEENPVGTEGTDEAENASAGPSDDSACFRAETRQEATMLLDEVGAFYRAREPSSPIPLLTDRARDLSQRDFLSILKDVLPGVSLRTTNTDE